MRQADREAYAEAMAEAGLPFRRQTNYDYGGREWRVLGFEDLPRSTLYRVAEAVQMADPLVPGSFKVVAPRCPRARRSHPCAVCGEKIRKGERYLDLTFVLRSNWGGVARGMARKVCPRCTVRAAGRLQFYRLSRGARNAMNGRHPPAPEISNAQGADRRNDGGRLV